MYIRESLKAKIVSVLERESTITVPILCTLQLLETVLTRGEVTEMMSLAVTAAQCMNKVAISREIREFTHKGKPDGRLKETVSGSAEPPKCGHAEIRTSLFNQDTLL